MSVTSSLNSGSPVAVRARLVCRVDGGFGIRVCQRTLSPPVLMVSALIKDGEADSSGLVRPGDIILQMNEVDLSNRPFEEALKSFKSLETELTGQTVRFLFRAPFGYTTRLETTFTSDGSPRTFRITERLYVTSNQHDIRAKNDKSSALSNGPSSINLSLVDGLPPIGLDHKKR